MSYATPILLHLAELNDAAERIAADGITAHEASADVMLATARRHRLSDILCRVLGDRSAPAVARERAYGMLAAELAAAQSRTSRSGGLAA